jgi:histo-blood group ABO system transferase
MKIAFLTIATNKYIDMAKALYESMCTYAFPDNSVEVDFLCFTNLPHEFDTLSGRINCKPIYLTHVPFPLISLLRYQYYFSIETILKNYDYVYHIDCDMLLKDSIGGEIVENRVCVIHPGFSFQGIDVNTLPYDRNQKSKAYVPLNEGKYYYQNCFQGGLSCEFVNMCKTLRNDIEENLRDNYIALWHDESYMNRYMINNPPTLILPPTYAQPQSFKSLGPTKILHVDKNHKEVRMSI